jgi:hypothetical protein
MRLNIKLDGVIIRMSAFYNINYYNISNKILYSIKWRKYGAVVPYSVETLNPGVSPLQIE